ncbi:unnamed protein product [Brassica rapa subsp. narinosa]|uniref:(rape) hypothetical protein n=2 Tax=Brassica TaxID=3705 RepID=A0A817AFV9_BRANA|nr:unnamed protein product [Brassica napus]
MWSYTVVLYSDFGYKYITIILPSKCLVAETEWGYIPVVSIR